MFTVKPFDVIGRCLEPHDALAISKSLTAGEVVDLALLSRADAKQALHEFEQILDCPTSRSELMYKQILLGQKRSLVNWGTATEDHAVLLNLDPYPICKRLFDTAVSISNHLRTPKENLLLSIIPSLRKTSTFPRYFHRESHVSLDQLKVEGKSPSIYRMTFDLGLENSSQILNVNLVPRRKLLNRDGKIKDKYTKLFQKDPVEVCRVGPDGLSAIQGQMTEDMLPFPETRRDLMVGRALIWLDDLFFHSPYLKRGRCITELKEHPRSIVIINEFRRNSYRNISWPPSVQRLLGKLVPDVRRVSEEARV